jgi:hypothetical protein
MIGFMNKIENVGGGMSRRNLEHTIESVRCEGSNGWYSVTLTANWCMGSLLKNHSSNVNGQPNEKPDNEASKQRLQVCDSMQGLNPCPTFRF